MFARRLRWFVVLMVAIALVIIGRLFEIQVVRADQYESLADRLLTRRVRYLSAPRGSIFDRTGRLLVSDEPASSVSVHYQVLRLLATPAESESSADAVTDAGADSLPLDIRAYLNAVARELRRGGEFPTDTPTPEIRAQLIDRAQGMLGELVRLTGTPREEIVARAARIITNVERIQRVVMERTDTIRAIAEEFQHHELLDGLDDAAAALAVRLELEARYPWLSVEPSTRRVVRDADTLVHVVGRLGAASPERIEADSLRGDEFLELRPGDRCGITGVERVAETTLRGIRGRVDQDFDYTELERRDPQRGDDVLLTIDLELQETAYDLLKQAVDKSENPAGGSAVVLDAQTREVLALVSYPSYSFEDHSTDYGKLLRDRRWQPLRFRAVANVYPPGSTCKVIALYGGLAEAVVSPRTRIHCTGYFRESLPNAFRCWIYNQYHTTHDARGNPAGQDAEDAVRNSCNIYFYTVGDRLGVDRLCDYFGQFGLGRTQGTGLIEESSGILPTSEWIQKRRRNDPVVRPSDAWNFSIGQGEVAATPLQCANVAATVATGRWEPVVLARDVDGTALTDRDAEVREFDERRLRVLRSGMWRVVNERGATAYTGAHLRSKTHVLCGKTGSAQAVPRVLSTRYVCQWPDGRRETVIARSKGEALARFDGQEPPEIVGWNAYERYPAWAPGDALPSHAWFIGYTQSASTPRGAVPRGTSYAISVLVEYGGSGGRVAGPVAKRIAEWLIERDEQRAEERENEPRG